MAETDTRPVPSLEELAARAQAAPAREKRASKAAPKPEQKSEPTAPKPPTSKEKSRAQIQFIARNFQVINDALAERADDDFYRVSETEAWLWAEAANDTAEELGVGEPAAWQRLVGYTIILYVPRAFHFWVTGKDRMQESELENYGPVPENGNGPMPSRFADKPAFVDE